MTNPPKHKTHFSQSKSTQLEPQNPHKVENIFLTDANRKKRPQNCIPRDLDVPNISQVNSQILYSCPQNTHKSEFQGQGPCSKLSPIQTQSRKLISYLLPQLGHGLSRLAGGASRCVKGELAQRNFLDFISLLPCPKAGQCSAKLSPDAARLTPNGYSGIFGKTSCVLGLLHLSFPLQVGHFLVWLESKVRLPEVDLTLQPHLTRLYEAPSSPPLPLLQGGERPLPVRDECFLRRCNLSGHLAPATVHLSPAP